MSILEKCERIGIELRNTKEGEKALATYALINSEPQEITVELFKLINKYYIQVHFFAIKQTISILENNKENPVLGALVKKILAINSLNKFGEENMQIGNFVEKLSVMSFNNSVKYQLPTGVSVTPELVRLSNSLTVECQRINLLQQIIKEFHTNPKFLEVIKKLDDLKGKAPTIPFSKQDRNALKTLKKEYPDSNSADLTYSLVCILAHIKSMIFDSFYDNIFEVFESDDIISRKEKQFNKYTFIKLQMKPNPKTFGPNSGWILKLHNKDNTISYAQIFNKTLKFEKNKCTISIKALVNNDL